MKNLLNFTAITTTMFLIMAFTTLDKSLDSLKLKSVLSKPSTPYLAPISPLPKSFTSPLSHRAFLESLGAKESSNNYKAVNKYGYLGKYQFGRKTLNNLGYRNVTNKQFLNSPYLQEEAMIKLLEHNSKALKQEIRNYSGKVIYGVHITPSGLLAAAHLGGPSNVKKFLRTGKNFKDGLGTGIKDYMIEFSGYTLAVK